LGPGLFDWAVSIDKKKFFITDISKYQIDVFSLDSKEKISSLVENAREIPIDPKDSELTSLGIDLPHILKPGAMSKYPAIWDISLSPTGKLIVFSGERDKYFRQVINIYDEKLNKIGTDYKYFRPTRNNFVFAGKLIYSVGANPQADALVPEHSPLDTVAISPNIRIFRSLL
jgi:hypothetical protein